MKSSRNARANAPILQFRHQQAALDRNARAKAFFHSLDSQNRYAVLSRIHTAKKAETRTKRIQ